MGVMAAVSPYDLPTSKTWIRIAEDLHHPQRLSHTKRSFDSLFGNSLYCHHCLGISLFSGPMDLLQLVHSQPVFATTFMRLELSCLNEAGVSFGASSLASVLYSSSHLAQEERPCKRVHLPNFTYSKSTRLTVYVASAQNCRELCPIFASCLVSPGSCSPHSFPFYAAMPVVDQWS